MGLLKSFDIETSGYTFEVETVSNFDVLELEFDKDEKRLTIFINSGLENNLGEIIIPQSLLYGNFTFYLNDVQHDQKIKSNNIISFITLNFTGMGNNKIDIIGTETFAEVKEKPEIIVNDEVIRPPESGGCLIATAIYGTELAPQIQQLREIRDQKLMKTESGQLFLNSFNEFYYSFSPIIADYERENPIFKEAVKIVITPMLSTLSILNYADSELEVITYGISLIFLNVGMYFVAPALVLVKIRKKF